MLGPAGRICRVETTRPATKRPVPSTVMSRIGAFVALDSADDVRAMTDDEIGAGIDGQPCETDHIASWLAVIFLFCKRQSRIALSLRAAVKGDDDDVMRRCELTYRRLDELIVEDQVRIPGNGVGEECNSEFTVLEACKLTFTARVVDADGIQRGHGAVAPVLAEVECMIIGDAQHVEAGVPVECGVSRRRAEQVARPRVTALLYRLASIREYAFQVADGEVGRRQHLGHVGEEAQAIIVGQVILGKVRAEHHVADERNTDAQVLERRCTR